MPHQFDPLSTQFTVFVAVNWFATLACAGTLAFFYFRRRFLFLKPSMVALTLCHFLFQWPLAIYSGYYETWLPQPYGIVLFVHGFVILGLAGSASTFNGATKLIWDRVLTSAEGGTESGRRPAIALLLLLCLAMAAIYFYYVPFSCTGLYALFVSPENQPLMREISLKLLADPAPRYSLSLLSAAVAPLLTGVVVAEMMAKHSNRRLWTNTGYIALLAVVWLLADLNGAKSILVSLSLVVVSTLIWRRGLSVSVWTLPVMLAVALLPAVILTLLIGFSPIRGDKADIKDCFVRVRLLAPQPQEELIAAFEPEVSRPQLATLVLKQMPPETKRVLRQMPPETERALRQMPPETERGGRADAVSRYFRERADAVSHYFRERADAVSYYFRERADAVSHYFRRLAIQVEVYLVRAEQFAVHYLNIGKRQAQAVLYRAVLVPFEVGVWYVHYMQTHEPIGFSAIPRVARWLGLDAVDAPNLIGRTYGPQYYGHSVAPTISAGASFIFTYAAYFGYWAIVVNLAALWLLDISLWVFGRVRDALLLPLVATSSITTLKFMESDYTVVWLTHGFGTILILGLVIAILLEVRLSRVRRVYC